MTERPGGPDPAGAAHGPAGWLVAGWLLATAARFGWAAYTGFSDPGVPWWSRIATAAVALLAAAAVVPFLRFHRAGWEMAMWVLVTALVMDVARIVLGTPERVTAALAAGASAFCLGYAWRIRAAFGAHEEAPAAVDSAASGGAGAEIHAHAVEDALGAIHRRIVAAGSACAVTREAVAGEAAHYGVGPDELRREGLPLYRTFLEHFRADGPLTSQEERELFCLEGVLGLDAIAVARLRAEAGAAGRAPAEAETEPAERDEAPAPAEPMEFVEMSDASGPAEAPRLADYEEYELDALLGWAGVRLPLDADARAALERLRALHHVSTEPPEEVDAGLPLQPGERCFAVRTVDLHRVPAGAAAPRPAPAGEGVLDPHAFVDGSLEDACDLADYQRAGACRFLVTDRRLLLVAPSGQQSPLPLDRIRAVRPCRNGLEAHPLRGSPVFLAFDDGVDEVAMRIRRAVGDFRAAPPA